MLKRRLCEASFEWSLTSQGPLLIADGRYEKREKDQERPTKVFVSRASFEVLNRTVGARAEDLLKLPFYVPGTSLRGPFRAQAERILRSLAPAEALPPATACDPFDMEEASAGSCSKRLDRNPVADPYAAACPACKLFGCTATASRIQFADADLPTGPGTGVRSVYRDMIGIDRFTGGVHSGANMRFHALEGATFRTTVTVRNFELWQLGLLAYVFQDFADGQVALGFGKSKGFGEVRGKVEKATLTYPAGKEAGKVHHLGSLASAEERKRYGLAESEPPAASLAPVKREGISLYESFTVEDLAAFWRSAAAAFNTWAEAGLAAASA
jgi:CRISPR-associated RAMP protein (TIGR02581 family)